MRFPALFSLRYGLIDQTKTKIGTFFWLLEVPEEVLEKILMFPLRMLPSGCVRILAVFAGPIPPRLSTDTFMMYRV